MDRNAHDEVARKARLALRAWARVRGVAQQLPDEGWRELEARLDDLDVALEYDRAEFPEPSSLLGR